MLHTKHGPVSSPVNRSTHPHRKGSAVRKPLVALSAALALFMLLLSSSSAPTVQAADVGYMKGAVLRTYLAGGGEATLGLSEGVEVRSSTYSAYWQGTTNGNVWWSRADGGKAVPDSKTVRLRGARKNFRDVAGEDADGLSMRRGVVYRSADLDDTSRMDRYILQTLGVTTDVMLNGGSDPSIAGITKVSAYMKAGSGSGKYEAFVTSSANRAALKKALTAIANAKGAVVIHCAAGKDRTGWLSAILQELAGVPQAMITREYLKSSWKTYGSQSVSETWLRRGLAKMRANYGTVEGYLTRGLGLSQSTVATLAAKVAA